MEQTESPEIDLRTTDFNKTAKNSAGKTQSLQQTVEQLDCCCWVTSVVSDSLRPHRRQPTRLPRPWDSPGKNTGVGCHFLLQCMEEKSESEIAQSCLTLKWLHGLQPSRVLHPWDFPGKSTGVGCHCLLRNNWTATCKRTKMNPLYHTKKLT